MPNFCKVKTLMPKKKWGSSPPVVTHVWISDAMKNMSSIKHMKKMAEHIWKRGQKVNFHISKNVSFLGSFVGRSPCPGIKDHMFCCYAAWAAGDSCSKAWRRLASAASLRLVSFSVWILDIKRISNNWSSLKLVNAVQDVSERSFIRFVILVELGVWSLHLDFHVLEKSIFPLWSVHLLSLFRNQRSQCLQVPILFQLLFCLFFLRHNFTLRSQGIWLVPPLVVFFGLRTRLLKVRSIVVFLIFLLDRLSLRRKWSHCV